MPSKYEIFIIEYEHLTIEVRYYHQSHKIFTDCGHELVSSLTMQTIRPCGHHLPGAEQRPHIDTDRSSCFLYPTRNSVKIHGGAAAFAKLWLRANSDNEAWQNLLKKADQLSLF